MALILAIFGSSKYSFFIGRFIERYLKMDEVQLISSDLVGTVNRHLRRLRLSMTARQPLSLHHFLASPEEELEHLRTVCDFLLTVLLPSSYALCVPLRLLLKEIFTCQGIYHVRATCVV